MSISQLQLMLLHTAVHCSGAAAAFVQLACWPAGCIRHVAAALDSTCMLLHAFVYVLYSEGGGRARLLPGRGSPRPAHAHIHAHSLVARATSVHNGA